MRRVEVSRTLPFPPAKVWRTLATAGFCEALTRRFAGYRQQYVREAPAEDAPGGLLGCPEVVLVRSGKRQEVRWKIVECVPPARLTLGASEHGLGVGSYDCTVEFHLSPEADGEKTRLEVSFYLLLLAGWLEFLTVVLPIRWAYAAKLNGLLAELKASVEKAV